MPAIRAVIFDLDGVLTDSEPLVLEACLETFHAMQIPVTQEDFRGLAGTGDEFILAPARKYGVPFDLNSFKKRMYARYLETVPQKLERFPGSRKLFSAARDSGMRLGLASSADWIKIEANLVSIGLPPANWDAVVSGEDVRRNKPAPEIFLTCAEQMDVLPSECAVIEDAVAGVRAAKAAGTRCIAVAHTFTMAELAEADLVRECLADVTLADLGIESMRQAASA